MKVVMIQPKAPKSHGWEALNIGYMKAYVCKFLKGIEWKYYSGFMDSEDEIVQNCIDVDFVGFSCTTPQTVQARTIGQKLKEQGSSAKTIWGGVHPSSQPEDALKHCDFVVQGEGESSLLKILGGEAKPGIVHEPYIENIDLIPPADRVFIKQWRNIAVTERNDKERIMSIFSSRGCPYFCVFCSSHEVWGRKPRLHSPERVVKEMELLKDGWYVDFIKFADDTFTVSEKRVFEICDIIKDRGLELQWGCNIRANTSDKLLRRMKETGCREVWIGAESGSPRILKDMKKAVTVELIKHIFKVTKDIGLFRRVYFMLGMPNESEEDVRLTEELATEIDADQYGFSMYCPFPGNSVFEPWMLEQYDWALSDEYRNPWTTTKFLTHERLIELQDYLTKRFSQKMCFRQLGGVTRQDLVK